MVLVNVKLLRTDNVLPNIINHITESYDVIITNIIANNNVFIRNFLPIKDRLEWKYLFRTCYVTWYYF